MRANAPTEGILNREQDARVLFFKQNSGCGFVDAQRQVGAGQRRQSKQDRKAKGEEKPLAAHDCLLSVFVVQALKFVESSSTHFHCAAENRIFTAAETQLNLIGEPEEALDV